VLRLSCVHARVPRSCRSGYSTMSARRSAGRERETDTHVASGDQGAVVQSKGACHRCSAEFRDTSKMTQCSTCQCRCVPAGLHCPRVRTARPGSSGKRSLTAFRFAAARADSDLPPPSPRARRFHVHDCGKRIQQAGLEAEKSAQCPKARASRARGANNKVRPRTAVS
jgi:hypothetical protein